MISVSFQVLLDTLKAEVVSPKIGLFVADRRCAQTTKLKLRPVRAFLDLHYVGHMSWYPRCLVFLCMRCILLRHR